ncbi:uncharacterized protein LOC114285307 [Camellia sinensis]|uniref:uncharacterized protein LOC114285307 n=1 Tax=Camellia sinensis TaxID=4442 RepID=UPI0010362EE7|nr:uncharacterized protein LOC114285307 [Camellia sinensis]
MSGIVAIWYAKLEDFVNQNWEMMAEAFIAQYSYNTQIEVTTRDLKTTRQEPKEGFSEFVIRWRAKASMMTTRSSENDQIRMVVRNLHGKLLQKMFVLPLFTFTELHEMGVQIENAMKQGLITDEKEPAKRPFVRSSNAAGGSTTARPLDVSIVTTTKTIDPFANTSSQTPSNPNRSHRTFNQLYMTLSQAMKVLVKKGHLKPLEPRPLLDPLPSKYNPTKYCAFH